MRLRAILLMLLTLALPSAADSQSYWGIRPGMTRGEVATLLGQPDEVLREGLVYRGYVLLPGAEDYVRVAVAVGLDSFYSTGRVTSVQARFLDGRPAAVFGRLWRPLPNPWDKDAITPVSGASVALDGQSTVTGVDGGFFFLNVLPGDHVLGWTGGEVEVQSRASEQQWLELGASNEPERAWVAVDTVPSGPMSATAALEYRPKGNPVEHREVFPVITIGGGITPSGAMMPREIDTVCHTRLTNTSGQKVIEFRLVAQVESPRCGITVPISWMGTLPAGGSVDLETRIPCLMPPTSGRLKLASVKFADGGEWKP